MLTPSILSSIIGVPNVGDNLFIDKLSTLDRLTHKYMLNEKNSIKGSLGDSTTKELKKKYRLFHTFIAYSVIPKKGHYNQVTIIYNFIIHRSAIR